MAKIYSFTEEDKEIINFLKNIVTVKYGSYNNQNILYFKNLF